MVIIVEKAIVKIDSELLHRLHSEHSVFLLYFIYELHSEHHDIFFMSGDRKHTNLPGDRKNGVRRDVLHPTISLKRSLWGSTGQFFDEKGSYRKHSKYTSVDSIFCADSEYRISFHIECGLSHRNLQKLDKISQKHPKFAFLDNIPSSFSSISETFFSEFS